MIVKLKKRTNKTFLLSASMLLFIIPFTLIISGCAPTSGDAFYKVERFEQAADLYIREAEEGDLEKMLQLAVMYSSGKINYKRDYIQASYWYEKAAGLGEVNAMHELAFIYEYGQGKVEQDLNKAIEWYLHASATGHAYSQYRLASSYAKRDADENDAVEAYRWFLTAEKSAQNCPSDKQCQIVLEDLFNYKWSLEKRMSEVQISAAKQLVAQSLVAPKI